MKAFEFDVSLRFFGKSFDPSDLAAEIGMKPVYTHKIGERRKTPKGTALEGVYDVSYCSCDVERLDDEELSETLRRSVDFLEQHKDLFNKIRSQGGRAEFFIGWFSTGNTGDTLPYELLAKLGALKIDLALDVYDGARSERTA